MHARFSIEAINGPPSEGDIFIGLLPTTKSIALSREQCNSLVVRPSREVFRISVKLTGVSILLLC